jgi:beta-lactamase regulating signal transducer with metallopeptidase domain
MLEKVFLQVINMSYIGSIVILFILAARILLKKAPKKYTYILWVVALFRLIVPISFESILSIMPVNPTPISNDIFYQTTPKVNTGISIIDQSISGSLPAAEAVASVNPMQIWVYIGALIWIVGIAILLIYGIISFVKLKRTLAGTSWDKDNIYTSDSVDTPFVIGLIQPKIYLPISLSEPEKEYIVLHERTHINRFDHVIRFISYLTLCIHWFNPFVWIAFWMSGEDMEMSCDESVISQLGHNVKKDYSQSLLNLATGKRNFGMTPLAFGEGETKGRVKNIVNFKKPKVYIVAIALLILIVAFIGLMTNPKRDSKYYANQFMESYTKPENLESTKYFRDVFYSGGPGQYSIAEYDDILTKDYGDLMTEKALDKAVSNRFIPWAELIREDIKYNIKVDSIDLVQIDIYDDGRVYYGYLLSLRVFFDDGKNETVSVSGDIVMIEENGSWIVDVFRWNPDYQDLNKLLFPHPGIESKEDPGTEELPEVIQIEDELWVNTGGEVVVAVDEVEIIGEITSIIGRFEWPKENNQANFDIEGSSYGYYEDNMVIKIEDKWILFSRIEDWAGINISGGFMSVGYDKSDEEEIFGDLNEEEINKVLENISEEVAEDEDYKKNKDSIIEKVFKSNGVKDPKKINAAKSKLIISK